MLTKRIIPCLDIKDGKTVKGVNFTNLVEAGDPVELAIRYEREGADELVFLDISASLEKRKTLLSTVERIAENLNIPFTVGGGISSIEDVANILKAGADKVSINSSAISNPNLITEISQRFGVQAVVVAIDARFQDGTWTVYSSGGTVKTNLELSSWARQVQNLGAGEILFTSMNADGTKSGFADEAILELNKYVSIPIIASGGAGNMEDFESVFKNGNADAALAASVFHFNEINIMELKKYLDSKGINCRI